MLRGPMSATCSFLLCLGCVAAGVSAAAAPADGIYEGTTAQGSYIRLTVAGGMVTGHEVHWACGNSSGESETGGTTCAIAGNGSFTCGSAYCGAPYAANIELTGVFTGSSVSGTFDLAFKPGTSGSCCWLYDVAWSASSGGAASTLSIGDTSVTEGDTGSSNATFQVSLSPAASSTVTVGWSTASGTAGASDFAASSGTLSFSPGQTSKSVQVAVYGDTEVEGNETFYVDLGSPSGATVADGRGQCTILDDDSSSAPELDIVIPAAARGAGSGGSVWLTRLYLRNTGSTTASATLYWFDRAQSNPSPTSSAVSIGAGDTLVLDDVIQDSFGLSSAGGAIGIASSQPLVASAAILNTAGGTEFGQGFEGIPVANAIAAGDSLSVVGLKHNGDYRTNVYLIDTTGNGAVATVSIVDTSGNVLDSQQYTLGPFMPRLDSLDSLGVPAFDDGAMVVAVSSGSVVAGASRVNQDSGDPVTLTTQVAATGEGGSCGVDGTYQLSFYDSWDWADGGGSLVIGNGSVASIDLTYFNLDHPSCNIIFRATSDFTPSASLGSFGFASQFDDGSRVTFTLALAHNGSSGLSGTIDASGSGFTGADAGCNGGWPQMTVRAGREQ